MKKSILILVSILVYIISVLVSINIVIADTNVNDTNITNTNTTNTNLSNTANITDDIGNTNETKVDIKIKTEYLEYDKVNSADKILVTVTSDRFGHFKYIENYYMKNVTGQAKFYVSQKHFETNLTENTISFNISRPTRLGNPYPFIRAIFVLDDKVVAKKWIDSYQSKDIRDKKEEKKSPGFNSILAITILVLVVYIVKKTK